jgi:hypothetical protein
LLLQQDHLHDEPLLRLGRRVVRSSCYCNFGIGPRLPVPRAYTPVRCSTLTSSVRFSSGFTEIDLRSCPLSPSASASRTGVSP